MDPSPRAAKLRHRAVAQHEGEMPNTLLPQTDEELLKLVHELQVHQIELEMLNEEQLSFETELRTSRDKFSLLYDFAPMGYFTLDRDGVILTVNLTGATLLGRERFRIVTQRITNFVADVDRTDFISFLGRVFDSQTKETCEVSLLQEDDLPIFVQLEAIAAVTGEECLLAAVDCTERIHLVNELLQSNDLLETKIQERTSELSQTVETLQKEIIERKKLEQQLVQSQKLEAIGRLAGGVAHDFNNLLTAISGFAEEIRERIPHDDDNLQENIGHVLKSAERAAELTRSLLALSRKQVLKPTPLLIDSLIAETGRLIRRVIGADIEFSIIFSCKKLLVMADVGQLEQVLMNLATNARDAMPHGGRLSFFTSDVVVKDGSETQYDLPSPGKYAIISIADTGAGIDSESMERLFEPYYTTKEVGKGTGLGLSIVYGIIKQHGGSVQVSSELGKGTTINIYIPLIEGEVAKSESKMSAPVAGGTETLLIAEDEEIVRYYLKKILEKAGYRVLSVCDGEEAVVLLRERNDISLVISDVVMPKQNGKELLTEIRKLKPEMKVIFISGYTSDIMHAKGIMEEGLNFIAKPFSRNILLRKIRELLDSR